MLFTDLTAGKIPTYVSVQNYYDSKIPVWFFNIDEILKEVEKLGFKVALCSPRLSPFFGKLQEIPQNNFPEKYRLKNSCNLLISKK